MRSRSGQPKPESVWVVLPTYDEAENLEALVAAVRGQLAAEPGSHQILVVDDNSPDGTGDVADKLAAASPDVRVLHRERKEGLGPAYIAGFREALAGGADLIVTMDADFSHDPTYVPALLHAAADTDLVLGSRYVEGGGVTEWGPMRRAISRGGSAYARIMLGIGVRDLTGGFKVFQRDVLEAIDLDKVESKGYAFQVEMTYRAIRAGFDVKEVPIVFRERQIGASKMSRAIVAEAIWRVPTLRWRVPSRRRRPRQ